MKTVRNREFWVKDVKVILIALGGAAVMFFLGIWAMNRFLSARLDAQIRKEGEGLPGGVTRRRGEQNFSHPREAADPARSGTPRSQSALMENQRYWDRKEQIIIRDSGVIRRMDEGRAFEGRKKTPEQFREQLERVEGRIQEYESKVFDDPGDEDSLRKLQDLYMLRASLSGLEDAVVEKER